MSSGQSGYAYSLAYTGSDLGVYVLIGACLILMALTIFRMLKQRTIR